jgi:hypothetical protein
MTVVSFLCLNFVLFVVLISVVGIISV